MHPGESLSSACIRRCDEPGTQGVGTGPTHRQTVGNGGMNRWCLRCYRQAGLIRNTQQRLCARCPKGHYQLALHDSLTRRCATMTASPAAGRSLIHVLTYGLCKTSTTTTQGQFLTKDIADYLWDGGIGFCVEQGDWANAPPLSYRVVRPLTAADWVPVRRCASMHARYREAC